MSPILQMSKMKPRVTLSQLKATLIKSGGTQIWNQFSGSTVHALGYSITLLPGKIREILEVTTKI